MGRVALSAVSPHGQSNVSLHRFTLRVSVWIGAWIGVTLGVTFGVTVCVEVVTNWCCSVH